MQYRPFQGHRKVAATALLAAGATIMAACAPAPPRSAEPAADAGISAEEVRDAVAASPAADVSSDDVQLPRVGDSIVVATTDAVVDIPRSSDGAVTLAGPLGGPTLELDLPAGAAVTEADVVAPGVVAYPSVDGAATAVQVPDAGGVAMIRILGSTELPRDQVFSTDLPDGARIEVAPEGHGLVVDAAGTVLFTIAPPWAVDGDGNQLPTHYSSPDGQSLVQHVDFDATTPTPITLDPWWSTVGNYARCVLGIGVPIGFAWAAIAAFGTKAALAAAMNSGRGLPPGFAGTAGRQYARWIWDGCSRFLRS